MAFNEYKSDFEAFGINEAYDFYKSFQKFDVPRQNIYTFIKQLCKNINPKYDVKSRQIDVLHLKEINIILTHFAIFNPKEMIKFINSQIAENLYSIDTEKHADLKEELKKHIYEICQKSFKFLSQTPNLSDLPNSITAKIPDPPPAYLDPFHHGDFSFSLNQEDEPDQVLVLNSESLANKEFDDLIDSVFDQYENENCNNNF